MPLSLPLKSNFWDWRWRRMLPAGSSDPGQLSEPISKADSVQVIHWEWEFWWAILCRALLGVGISPR